MIKISNNQVLKFVPNIVVSKKQALEIVDKMSETELDDFVKTGDMYHRSSQAFSNNKVDKKIDIFENKRISDIEYRQNYLENLVQKLNNNLGKHKLDFITHTKHDINHDGD